MRESGACGEDKTSEGGKVALRFACQDIGHGGLSLKAQACKKDIEPAFLGERGHGFPGRGIDILHEKHGGEH